ncbi:MAG: hypothetical protein IJH12_10570 [Clostridia bacterium]|nr:hypothetical protein [Clostridia bacterium]
MDKEFFEERETYEVDNHKYTVITRTIENKQSLDNLYKAFSKYALKKLNSKI